MRCILLSDLHVRRRPRAGDNQALARVVDFLRRRHATGTRPHIVLTGDVTHNGAQAEYRHAVELLRPLVDDGFPLLPCPGNHDVGPLGNSFMTSSRVYFQQYVLGELLGMAEARTARDRMGEFYPRVTEEADAMLVGLDSATQEDYLASGRLGAGQLERLRKILAGRDRSRGLLVYVHHHPFMRRRSMAIHDAGELLAMLDGQADALCFGHRHRWGKWIGERGIGITLASGKTTKKERRRGLSYWEVTVGRGAPTWARRWIPRR